MDSVTAFAQQFDFPLDRFQLEAMEALAQGRSALVAAPTGAGKTIVGEFCLYEALQKGGRAFYTTPIKALSNQKYRDLCAQYGDERVGLLTGDNAINGDAPLVVMTTEVLRNMIYEQAPGLEGLMYVVLDEVHYLGDQGRGMVWEEVIISLSHSVTIASLSATVSNAEEFGAWLASVRNGCEVVISEVRPVPLDHTYAIGHKFYPMFKQVKGKRSKGRTPKQGSSRVPNPDVVMLERRSQHVRIGRSGRRIRVGEKVKAPWRSDLVEMLAQKQWLPAIVFIFSRAACDDAVDQVLGSGIVLTSANEQEQIRKIIDRETADVDPADLATLDFGWWAQACERGVAAHHAGMVPIFKETTEKLFAEGLVKLVYATETLALGINMPARTVVIERLEKWNGQRHDLLTPGQFTQLTGRAGRRGKDTIGHAVVNYQRDLEFEVVASLVGRRTERLRSQFTPTANMAVNLLRRYDLATCDEILSTSFAQWQADTNIAGNTEELERFRKALTGYKQHLVSDYGDFEEYWALRRELSRTQKTGAKARKAAKVYAITQALAQLTPGDVIRIGGGRRGTNQLAAVVDTNGPHARTPLVVTITEHRRVEKIGPRDIDYPPAVIGRIDLPDTGSHRKPVYRKEVQIALTKTPVSEHYRIPIEVGPEVHAQPAEIERLKAAIADHPVHDDPTLSELEVWAYRHDEVLTKIEAMEGGNRRRTRSLSDRFIAVVAMLRDLGYLDAQPKPTEEGLMLARIHGETDVVLCEAIRAGIPDHMNAVELAAWVSIFTYESRRSEDDHRTVRASGRLGIAWDQTQEVYNRVVAVESSHRLPATRPLNPELMDAMARWASGDRLEDALVAMDMSAGDFVRATKMCADTLRQIRTATTGNLSRTAREAADLIVRGVVDW
ncbi:DEAD/DEAH box helicase [Stomatohabitans albus]|uniref:DEAD/DEAH box helicase n=1 Tax=Stomatohabitans albus TaxID=3110766 RepID=UPI00300D62BA